MQQVVLALIVGISLSAHGNALHRCLAGLTAAVANTTQLVAARPKRKLDRRGAGMLLAVSSAPGKYGVGDFGSVLKTIAWMKEAKLKWWQVLPLNPADSSNSPFSSDSSLALDLAYLDLEDLVALKLVDASELQKWEQPETGEADYAKAREIRAKALDIAFAKYKSGPHPRFKARFDLFRKNNDYWIGAHSSFTVLKAKHGYDFTQWPKDLRDAKPSAVTDFRLVNEEAIERAEFEQFLLDRQWRRAKKAAGDAGISVIGDMPMYVARYSADVWSNPDAFLLDADRRPTRVSGYPPCNFYKTGQLWGTPVYDWPGLKKSGYKFWLNRMRRNLDLYDVVRIDHFLAFHQYYGIDATAATAESGIWYDADGEGLFAAIVKKFGASVPLIAEDLGASVPKQVHDLRNKYGIPGMFVVQFGHGGDQPDEYHSTGKMKESGVAYTGNHDNPTLRQWISETKNLDSSDTWEWIERLLAADTNVAIVPAQDFLDLDASARMNLPGTWSMSADPNTRRNNWVWRLLAGQLSDGVAKDVREAVGKTKR